MFPRVLPFALLALAAAAGLRAQQPPPQPPPPPLPSPPLPSRLPSPAGTPAADAENPQAPVLDALAEKTLARWRGMLHHPGHAGVRKVRFDIAVTSRGGMTGTWRATGTFRFDATTKNAHGLLAWEDDEITAAMTRRGWTAPVFARDYQADPLLRRMQGAKVTGTARENGTILAARSAKGEATFWLFDQAGVLVGSVAGPMKTKYLYDVQKDKTYLRAGVRYTAPDATGDVTVWHREVQGLLLPVKIREVVKVKGETLSDLTFVLSNHVIDAGTKRRPATPASPASPASPSAPSAPAASRPTSRPARQGPPK